MSNWVKVLLWAVWIAGCLIAGLLVGLAFRGDNAGPGQAFETHIQALVDGEWELAHSYLSDDCDISVAEARNIQVNPSDWRVDKVFLEDDEALLYFGGSGRTQYMLIEDGGWKISCEGLP
jgi:hypothetical protein